MAAKPSSIETERARDLQAQEMDAMPGLWEVGAMKGHSKPVCWARMKAARSHGNAVHSPEANAPAADAGDADPVG